MKRRIAREGMEGWLMAGVLCIVLAAALCIQMNRQPRSQTLLPVHAVSADALEKAERVNINEADVQMLTRLPGVGETLAQRIVEWRGIHGPFEDAQALLQIEGIGEKKLAGMMDLIRME